MQPINMEVTDSQLHGVAVPVQGKPFAGVINPAGGFWHIFLHLRGLVCASSHCACHVPEAALLGTGICRREPQFSVRMIDVCVVGTLIGQWSKNVDTNVVC